jgi:hypothetical protein
MLGQIATIVVSGSGDGATVCSIAAREKAVAYLRSAGCGQNELNGPTSHSGQISTLKFRKSNFNIHIIIHISSFLSILMAFFSLQFATPLAIATSQGRVEL